MLDRVPQQVCQNLGSFVFINVEVPVPELLAFREFNRDALVEAPKLELLNCGLDKFIEVGFRLLPIQSIVSDVVEHLDVVVQLEKFLHSANSHFQPRNFIGLFRVFAPFFTCLSGRS